MSLLAVALATSGSRGQRLLFFYPAGAGSRLTEPEENSLTILKELPPSLLGELLTPSSQLVNKRFGLQVDKWKFVGHPKTIPSFKDGDGIRMLQFNVVFILETSADADLVEQCHSLSDQLGTCLIHEEKRCAYVSQEVERLLNRVDYSNLQTTEDFALVYSLVAKESTLAKTIVKLFNSVKRGDVHISETVNYWSGLSWGLPRTTTHTAQPFHSFLLLGEAESVVQSLPKEASPAFSKLLSVHSPVQTLQTLSEDCDLPLDHVLRLVDHLVQWRKACIIHPLVDSNVYMLTRKVDISCSSPLHGWFEKWASAQNVSGPFLDAASSFSEALPLSDIQSAYQQHEFVPVVTWMLQKQLITKLNTYVFLLPSEDTPISSPDMPTTPSPTSPTEVRLDDLKEFSEEEQASVLKCTQHKNKTDIETLCSLLKYFRGNSSVADMAQYELLRSSQILTIIDMFSCVLVTAAIPDST